MAHAEKESLKKHGDALEKAMEDADRHSGPQGTVKAKASDPIPMPENGGHERSHAAHLGGRVHEQTKPTEMIRQGAASNDLREPPMVVQRVGKQHR